MYIYDTENEISNRLRFFDKNVDSRVNTETISVILDVLKECNELVKLFVSARDLCHSSNTFNYCIRLFNSYNSLSYDRPSPGCIGAIITDLESQSDDYDIVIHHNETGPQRINKLHPLYMALQYPLLFVYGDSGWSRHLRLRGHGKNEDKNLTMNMFYSYQLHDRLNVYTHLLRGGRLFQQYLVDSYICTEQSRLDYIRKNQNSLRTEFLRGIHDAVEQGDTRGSDIGKRTILPSTFTGGPRYMYKHYQDALAICRVHGNPQYFITFTCNVKWPEIQRYLAQYPSLKAQDRQDIIARVFHIKVLSLISYLKTAKPFGALSADLYTIEFRKRGLPHCHLLLWVSQSHQITKADQLDNYISAELPDPITEPHLYKIVSEFMMHGPCGIVNPHAPCMSTSLCSKKFPKSYELSTSFDKNGYAHYKRRLTTNTVLKKGIELDNSYVVPYNRFLLLRYQAHINVEYCGWNMLIKYLFKYISKGSDRICYRITRTSSNSDNLKNSTTNNIDEIKIFFDGRFICPHESAWRIFNFLIHDRNPPVQTLSVHLEDMQNITFKDNEHLDKVLANPATRHTTLTEWLHTNQIDQSGRHLRYVDYLSEYRWDQSAKTWIHIRSVFGEIFPTYRATCEKLGLLHDDNEWICTYEEAARWATSMELRYLFIHMLQFCDISNPRLLWNTHWHTMVDDIVHREGIINDEDQMQYVLYELELLLRSGSTSSSLVDFGLPLPKADALCLLRNKLLMEEKNYDRVKLASEHQLLQSRLTSQQRYIYDHVLTSLASNKQVLAFVYGHGGTGKTFLWKTIICALRSEGKIVLAVAASGLASLLLPSGRTAHSRFKIPFDLTEESTCHIKEKTQLAQLLGESSLIVWDEAPMNDRKCFESLDKCLKEILDNSKKPFGGKSVMGCPDN
ncbi:hypothetical protein E3N88_24002 [Mikania micrantha]|uniref:ATP-dependent DNA helicase n=1 Tax=Mikania micrantha TaxID=192012 RepID=A0A5N6NEV3_9ASTR|nr:hypothetical protein E3N88_24002 [Mikania micrantha]